MKRLTCVMMLALLAACGQALPPAGVMSKTVPMNEAAYDGAGSPPPAPGAARAEGPSAEQMRPQQQRLVITTGTVTVEVKELEPATEALVKKIAELGGFISGSEEHRDQAGRRYGSTTARVPAEKYQPLLAFARGLGTVESLSANAQDVTEKYYDLESRLKSKKKLEEELLAVMESSRKGGITDLLTVEREVERVRSEIEVMEGQRRYLADQAALSTLTVELKEPEALITTEPRPWAPLAEALGNSITVFSSSLGGLILVVVGVLPWVVALLLLGWLVSRIIRRLQRK